MRLRPLTEDRPKSVVPVLNRPAMEHTFAYLRRYGIKDIILAISYLPDVIQQHFGDGSRCGVRLTYCLEKEPLGTAGAVKNAAAFLNDTFFVMNGDIFTDLNLADILARHKEKKAVATISLAWVDDPSAFGVVETDDSQKVKRFIEKPPLAEATTHWINAGTYVLEPEILEHIPADTHYMFERGLFPGLLEAGKPVYAFPYRGFWLDMGSPSQYFSLNTSLLNLNAKSPLVSLVRLAKNGISRGANINIHPSASIMPPAIIGDGCRIGAGVKIKGPAIIGPDCRLEDGAVVENVVLWDNIIVGVKTSLAHCIVVSRAVIDGHQEVADSIITPAQTVPLPR